MSLFQPGLGAYGGQAPPSAAPVQTPEQKLAQMQNQLQQSGNILQTGYNMGSLNEDPVLDQRSQMRADQTNAERYAAQQANYAYGGYAGGADAAIGDVRANVTPYATNLGNMGSDLYGQAGVGMGQQQQGVAGVYDQAGALSQYAQQGPGPSVAQAQLQANTAQAMRQQLALAGSGRGAGGGAAAFRQAAGNQAQIQGQANAQASMLQAQEAQYWRQAQLAAMQGAGGLYGQGAGLGGDYAQGMGGLGLQGQQAGGQLQLGAEQQIGSIEGNALQATGNYENNLTDIYGIGMGVQKPTADPGLLPIALGVGGAAVGTYFGGPGGGAALGGLGYATGRELEK